MKLAEFYARIGPCLEGAAEADLAATRAALYGPGASGADAQRLAIYERFCHIHRFEALEAVYPHLHELAAADVAGRAGEGRGAARWARLVERYFRAVPMHHVELRENGDGLSDFLVEHAAALELPPWSPALADLEWWAWRVEVALDDQTPAERAAGPLRIAPTVELRPYDWDLLGWIEADPRPTAPAARSTLVLLHRDRDEDVCWREPAASTLRVLQAVHQADGATLSDPALSAAIDALRDEGVLDGEA